MVLLAPDGLAKLREEVAGYALAEAEPPEIKADQIEAQSAFDAARQRRKQASQDLRDLEPRRASAENAFVQAEKLGGIPNAGRSSPSRCHGSTNRSNGALPPMRWSASRKMAASWRAN